MRLRTPEQWSRFHRRLSFYVVGVIIFDVLVAFVADSYWLLPFAGALLGLDILRWSVHRSYLRIRREWWPQ